MNGTIQKGQQYYMRRKTQSFSQWTMIACNNWYSDHNHLKHNCPLRHFSRSLKYLFRLFVYNVTQDTYINNPTVYKATQKTTMEMSVNEFTYLHKLVAHRVVNKMYRNGTTTAVVYRTVRWIKIICFSFQRMRQHPMPKWSDMRRGAGWVQLYLHCGIRGRRLWNRYANHRYGQNISS